MKKILIVKETRAGETRVALIPEDVKALIAHGLTVFIEHDAGKLAGFFDQDYSQAGANIRYLEDEAVSAYQALFKEIDIVVRVKRPDRQREILENKVLLPGTIMIGALDPLEKNSLHIDEYRHAHLITYSIDQLELAFDDPMNILAAMSKIAGKLAFHDAVSKFHSVVKKAVIIGFGVVGQSAFAEALCQHIATTVILSKATQAKEIQTKGGISLLIDNNLSLVQQQNMICNTILDADVVIASARHVNQNAPLLIPKETLQQMKKGSVIVDMALSEGGNVEGSEHDSTHILGNEVLVTNVSGYPKAVPREASMFWSRASRLFILKLQRKC